MKQSSLDEQEQLGMELEAQNAENEEDISDYYRQFDDPMNGEKNGTASNEAELNKQNSVSNSQPPEAPQHPTLPWAPKVRNKDIYQFLDISRRKFIGYSLPDNCETTAGLPKPICEGINILRRVKHLNAIPSFFELYFPTSIYIQVSPMFKSNAKRRSPEIRWLEAKTKFRWTPQKFFIKRFFPICHSSWYRY